MGRARRARVQRRRNRGAAVDRNGLRPCRYKVRRDGLVVAGSEVGLVDLDPREVVECGKVGPGEVLVVTPAGAR